jgi:hypothetical protein
VKTAEEIREYWLSTFDKNWTDKQVYKKAFWTIAVSGHDTVYTPPEWFVLRYVDIKKVYDELELERWALEAVNEFLNSGDDNKKEPKNEQ